MKKITFGILSLFMHFNANANVIVKDITDFTFTADSSLNIDFNNDNTAEFILQEMHGSIGCFFTTGDVSFIGTGSVDSGHGWDIMKSLTMGTTISSSSLFAAQVDAYINPFWANPNEKFPVGDSYVGCFFKIAGAKHYGWLLVNSTQEGVITLKSYAYNDVAEQSITAGQTLSSDSFEYISVEHYPNPVSDKLFLQTTERLKEVFSYDVNSRRLALPFSFTEINLNELSSGIYFLDVIFENEKKSIIKVIKK